jgi:hypothetical protein
MLKRFISILFAALLSGVLCAQEAETRPQRTPQEEALKQTTRLVRELGIKDSTRIDTIYRMHLKYALFRQKGLTRAQNMERMQAIYAELQALLTPEEFERFMNHPAEQPRRPHGANVLTPAKQPQPTELQPADRQ